MASDKLRSGQDPEIKNRKRTLAATELGTTPSAIAVEPLLLIASTALAEKAASLKRKYDELLEEIDNQRLELAEGRKEAEVALEESFSAFTSYDAPAGPKLAKLCWDEAVRDLGADEMPPKTMQSIDDMTFKYSSTIPRCSRIDYFAAPAHRRNVEELARKLLADLLGAKQHKANKLLWPDVRRRHLGSS
ncbi:hypothetical protein KFE25_003178 [Diacronema lutheri]|uniref:Uncharacterized protein n=1 Tax=Diacronema lutheri TaxID=2081491 RepID=A0A8J6C627_DIALT|nr:hypothetical protein KFE25_003178 [Diacronema lutheri]